MKNTKKVLKKNFFMLVIACIMLLGTISVSAMSANIQNFTLTGWSSGCYKANGNISYDYAWYDYSRSAYLTLSYHAGDFWNCTVTDGYGDHYDSNHQISYTPWHETVNAYGVGSYLVSLDMDTVRDPHCLWINTTGYTNYIFGGERSRVYLTGGTFGNSPHVAEYREFY